MSDTTTTSILAWHFLRATEEHPQGVLRDGRLAPADGEWLVHDGDTIRCCFRGLHASVALRDAMRNTSGTILCRVECDGVGEQLTNQFVSLYRKVLWRLDATDVLRAFARRCALDVAHRWAAPETVLRYLRSGLEHDRIAASTADKATVTTEAEAAAEAAAKAATVEAATVAATEAAVAAAWAEAWAGRTTESCPKADADARLKQDRLLEAMIEEARNGRTEWVFP